MDYIKINNEELSALRGLPHIQQLLYLTGIKPYVDYKTGMVGIVRGISYQSLAEELYVEPHQGIKSGSPSKDQIRRAIKGLEKAGLLRIQSLDWKLVFQCLLVKQDSSCSNKPAAKPHEDCATMKHHESPLKQSVFVCSPEKPITIENNKAAIPQNNNNYFVFLTREFEKFWESYPLKKSKQKTWEQFQALQPTEALMSNIHAALGNQVSAYSLQQAQGLWVPGWKFPANWLAQHCWNDEINTDTPQESRHAKLQTNPTKQPHYDMFWESCKAGADYNFDAESSHTSNPVVIDIENHRKRT